MKVSVVIPAAGRGSRMKTEINKQFLTLKGQSILARTIDQFQARAAVDEIVVVAHKEETAYCQQEIISKYNFAKVTQVVKGGSTRQESVYKGLSAVDEETDFVLTHDGARPLLTEDLIEDIIEQVQEYEAVIAGVPVKDTIKILDQDQMAVKTPDRSKLVAVQTPQAFTRELVLRAYQQAQADGFTGTDSASLVERLGQSVKVVRGTHENLKITTPEDLELAEAILEMR